jgi:hypothetical protein
MPIETLKLPGSVKVAFEAYVKKLTEQDRKNPYLDHPDMGYAVAHKLAELLHEARKEPSVARLWNIIREKAEGKAPPVVMVTNGPSDSEGAFLPNETSKGHSYYSTTFDNPTNPVDRGKTTFIAEWFELALSQLMGHELYVQPREHITSSGQSNAFHQVSLREADVKAEKRIASTGIVTVVPWHTENAHDNLFKSETEARTYYSDLGVDLAESAGKLGIDPDTLIKQAMENAQNKKISALILTYSAAGKNHTPTSMLTGQDFKDAIVNDPGLGEDIFKKIIDMNIAFKAGAVEGKHAGTATIGRMVDIDAAGNMTAIRFNCDIGRMAYIGYKNESPEEFSANKTIFERVCDRLNHAPGTQVILQRGDYLLIDNSYVAHCRDKMDERDLAKPLQDGNLEKIRRLTRAYLSNDGRTAANIRNEYRRCEEGIHAR